jgi:hypothetical protein
MMKFRKNLPVVFSLAFLSFAFLVSFGVLNEAKAAKCDTNACLTGYGNCLGWCGTHNKTTRSQGICSVKCGDYWQDGKSLAKDPTKPSGPPRKVDPGRLKNPPTTVSNPNAPTRPPTEIREKQKK